jgi:hypothetical protein
MNVCVARWLVAVLGCVIAGCTQAAETVLLKAPVPVATSDANDIFPESWRKAPVSAQGGLLPEAEHDRVARTLEKALAKYPVKVLQKHLKKVYVLSELKYSGVSAGGTNSLTVVYLKVGPAAMGFTDRWIEDAFHAELSSILLRNRSADLDQAAWRKLNPDKFEYLGNGVEAIKIGQASTQVDAKLAAQGFLCQYARSSQENDFNAFASALLLGDEQLWELADKHPRIAGKLKLMIAFYHALDDSFTEASFRALVRK